MNLPLRLDSTGQGGRVDTLGVLGRGGARGLRASVRRTRAGSSCTDGGWQSLSFDIASPVNVPDNIWLGFSFNNSRSDSPLWGVGMAESPVIGHSDGLFYGQNLYPWGNFSLSVATVPEPFTLALCAGGLGLALARRRKSA